MIRLAWHLFGMVSYAKYEIAFQSRMGEEIEDVLGFSGGDVLGCRHI